MFSHDDALSTSSVHDNVFHSKEIRTHRILSDERETERNNITN